MFKAIKEFFVGKPVEAAAPYKVEAPAPVAVVNAAEGSATQSAPVIAEVAAVTVETVASFSTVVSEGTAPVAEAAPAEKPKRAAKPKAAAKPAAKPAAKTASPKLTVVKTTKAKSKKA